MSICSECIYFPHHVYFFNTSFARIPLTWIMLPRPQWQSFQISTTTQLFPFITHDYAGLSSRYQENSKLYSRKYPLKTPPHSQILKIIIGITILMKYYIYVMITSQTFLWFTCHRQQWCCDNYIYNLEQPRAETWLSYPYGTHCVYKVQKYLSFHHLCPFETTFFCWTKWSNRPI